MHQKGTLASSDVVGILEIPEDMIDLPNAVGWHAHTLVRNHQSFVVKERNRHRGCFSREIVDAQSAAKLRRIALAAEAQVTRFWQSLGPFPVPVDVGNGDHGAVRTSHRQVHNSLGVGPRLPQPLIGPDLR